MSIHEILKQYWGYETFRPLQEEIIRSVLDNCDTLALLPTGGGKSVCYQVPAMAMDGVCIVVSPLISLIKDQVQQLQKRGIPALSIYSGMAFREIDKTLDAVAKGHAKFLYVSPERLQTELFQVRVQNFKVNLLAVDEAHCISQWGYDFRPSYLKIADIKPLLGDVPILALTATATQVVREDIKEKMQFGKDSRTFVQSFDRKNLSYSVLKEENKSQRLQSMLQKVNGSGIVFVNTRKRTKDLSWELSQEKIKSSFYHAGLTVEERNRRQQDWIENRQRIIVCTNAFGMGIDKPDVRIVVHMEPPESPEAYFQEAGRAGRDGRKAFAVCLYEDADLLRMQEKFEESFPSIEEIKRVYQAVSNYLQIAEGAGQGASYDFDLGTFCKTFNLKAVSTFNALKALEQEGYIEMSESLRIPSRIIVLMNREELYRFEVQNPTEEPLIKTLLRLYGGIFDSYVPVRERDIAFQLKDTLPHILSRLKFLQQQNVIDYLPIKDAPQLTFTLSRKDVKDLRFDEAGMKRRKEGKRQRLEAIVKYVTTKDQCRSQMLLKYFGEEKTERCGICDVCLERHKLEMSDEEIETHVGTISTLLKQSPRSIKQLIESLPQIREDKLIHVTRWLMDVGLVEEVELKLQWKK